MAFKRNQDFKKCIASIKKANYSKEYHLVITQSVSMKDYSEFKEMDEILNKEAVGSFKSVIHIDTESSSSQAYGNAYFAFKNLVYGLEHTLKLFPSLANVIVFEEDVEVSQDVFEFFKKSSQLISGGSSGSNKNNIILSTTAFFLHTTHPQYNWLLDKPLKRKSVRNELSMKSLNNREIQVVTFNGEIEFKVLSWMMNRFVMDTLIQDFKIIEKWVLDNEFQDQIENKPNTKKPELLVKHCDCWNHDRYIESRFKGYKFIGSQSPRCNHIPQGGKGLSNVLEDYGFPVNQIYTTSDQFYFGKAITGEKDIWQVIKDYLPNFECPSRIDCYNNQTQDWCGSVKVSTCLNIWNLECIPCSGRSVASLSSQCNENFSTCCNSNLCNSNSPFFISLKQH